MINIRDLRIDPASLGAKKLLVDIVPVYEYKNNQRTDEVVAFRYIVALPALRLEKIGVKIDGKQLMDKHGAAGCKRGKHCPFYIAYRNRKIRKKWRIRRWQQ